MSASGERTVELSRQDKVLFPESGVTKGDLVDYYRRVARRALPYWRDRALTMQRFPDGVAQSGFYAKEAPEYFPDWIERVTLPKEEGGETTYVMANNAETLVYLANQACVTPHLALARQDRPRHPDRLILDLDPSDDDFGKVQEAAAETKRLLDALDLSSFVMTTGSRGLHVVLPLDRSGDFDAARGFARDLADRLADRRPDLLTTEMRKQARGDRVFVDYLRNAYGQTAVAPYAGRAWAEA
ncbi:MAG: non-homologous end-joining DNA ligase, partial [Alphaproteobacteria bacterium]